MPPGTKPPARGNARAARLLTVGRLRRWDAPSLVLARFVHNANVMKVDYPSRWALALAAALLAPAALATEAGEAAPMFTLPTATGESVALDKLRGKVVYVDFWASWCGPCRRSFPWMNEMQQKFGSRGFVVVGVNVDKRRGDAQRFLAQIPAAFAVVYDESGATPSAYGVKGMPSSYLIDAQGKVAYVERGFLDDHKADLEQRVVALLAAAKN
jgi:cytochrome c biogenesis protein CcmG/thiol:disulfide interchange protein DsbE